ncbi:DUF1254 domain-containing protein [Xanthobacter versatilis]|uniref:DUF1254 domain-containing protein n=1 Tax=Xanthobacter autotrophicus (strain ATCC BAA-1158 / Py2) TaxID=78245 RepID=UPI00372D2807
MMNMKQTVAALLVSLAGTLPVRADPAVAIPVSTDNFVRAESDLYFAGIVKNGGFGKFDHTRAPAPIDKQTVIRLNRDTLYSSAVFDLDAGPVTITLPEAGSRFMSMQVFDEDQYTHGVHYKPGKYTLTKKDIGTRYAAVAIRTLVNPSNPEDVKKVHALQDAVTASQQATGSFEIPNWDQVSQKKVRDALLSLATLLPDTKRMFGSREDVDPVRFVIGAAMGWGANPPSEALYLNVTPPENDGTTVYKLKVNGVPVDGFWSISVYNAEGYFQPNDLSAYSLNNVTAKKDKDGFIEVQFGGCTENSINCLPIVQGWNYMVRLYRPHREILDGTWKFPEAKPAE